MKWHYLEVDASLKPVHLYDEGQYEIPCAAFINEDTGELKLFSRATYERRGRDVILKELNKKEK